MKRIVGYCDPWSVQPGDQVSVMVSTYGADRFHAGLVRVICGDDRPLGPGFAEEPIAVRWERDYPGRTQSNPIGSYVRIPESEPLRTLQSFTAQTYVYATTPHKGRQALLAQWDRDRARGFALSIGTDGSSELRVAGADGAAQQLATGVPLLSERWYLVTGSYEAASGELRLEQRPLFSLPGHQVVRRARHGSAHALAAASVPLTMAALPDPSGGRWGSEYFNGKLDRPRLAARALDAEALAALDAGPDTPLPAHIVGCWDFSRDISSEAVTDLSTLGHHGETVNLPARGCKGHNWDGSYHDWRAAPAHYGAIHFHDDDLCDAQWSVDFSFVVPGAWRSGVYAIKLEAAGDSSYLPLFVRPPEGQATAPLAFLASSATYIAYANTRITLHVDFAEVRRGHLLAYDAEEVFAQEHGETGLSTYDTHSDGSGVRYCSRLRPILNTGLKTRVWNFNADTHLLAWLEHEGIAFDVITDEDLEREGAALLSRYRAVVSGTHPEYWSTRMWRALSTYQQSGGRFLYLGGNGFYWRIAFHPTRPGIIEVRRPSAAAKYWQDEPGEYHLSFSGELGDLWRRCGEPPQTLVGIGTRATGFDRSSYYRFTPAARDPRITFMLQGLSPEELLGNFGSLGGGASGLEIDAADFALGTPPHALIVASSEEHSPDMMFAPEEILFQHSMMSGEDNPEVKADVVFYETVGGGAVFSVGSIAWCASLAHNGYRNNVARLMVNVMRRFLSPEPFSYPESAPPTELHPPGRAILASVRPGCDGGRAPAED
jgi:N,N-dimethylformamidase